MHIHSHRDIAITYEEWKNMAHPQVSRHEYMYELGLNTSCAQNIYSKHWTVPSQVNTPPPPCKWWYLVFCVKETIFHNVLWTILDQVKPSKHTTSNQIKTCTRFNASSGSLELCSSHHFGASHTTIVTSCCRAAWHKTWGARFYFILFYFIVLAI
jgi:hypothetical protein